MRKQKGLGPPSAGTAQDTANKTYAQTITARFVAEGPHRDGSPEAFADLAKKIAAAGSLLVQRSTPKKGHHNMQLIWRGRALLAAADALLGQAHDDGYQGVWAATWTHHTTRATKRKPGKL